MIIRQTILLFLLFAVLSFSVAAQSGHDQTLVFRNPGKITGKLYIGWYKSATDFRKPDKAVLKKIIDTRANESIPAVFENVPPGTYAIAVFLDENGNGKMDTNFFGIPKEKYGFSNNVYPLMRAASFKESAITVLDKEGTFTIRLK